MEPVKENTELETEFRFQSRKTDESGSKLDGDQSSVYVDDGEKNKMESEATLKGETRNGS